MSSHSLSKHILYQQQYYGFQHLYLEYYAYLYGSDEEDTKHLLHQGLSYNLKVAHFSPDTLQPLQNEIKQVANNIITRKEQLIDAFKKFHASPSIDNSNHSLFLHRLLQEQLVKNSFKGVSALVEQLKQGLEIDPFDYWTECNLAWVYFHIIQDIQLAERHFTQAVNNSSFDNTPLKTIAQRYLAYTKMVLENKNEARVLMHAIINQQPLEEAPQQLFESAQFEDFTTESQSKTKKLKAAIDLSPLYYIQIQSDALLREVPQIQSLLAAIYSAKLMQIHELAQHKWKASSIYSHDLPVEIDKQGLFNETFEQYRELLCHQAYPILCKTEEISGKILAKVTIRTKQKLDIVQTSYTKKIITINKKWQAINKLGGGLVYIASILGFSSVLLFTSLLLLGEMIAIPTIQWKLVIPIFFMLLLLLAFIGFLLLRYTPQASRDLSQKKASIVDALNPKRV